jgi:VWFA-related protein
VSPRNTLAAAAVAIAAGLGPASGAAGQRPPAEGRAPVHTVRIDAIAVDATGAAIGTLTARDFELREDGELRALDEARFVTNEPRLVAIYLNEYHITPGASADRARDALTAFVDRELGPRDLVVVMKPLDSLFTIRLTDDREKALRTIAELEGRKGDHAPRTPYERTFMTGSPARIEAVRSQVTISALNALAVHMATLSGVRKTLLVVGEGLEEAPRRRGQEYLATIESVVRSANRANVSIYPIDPRPASNGDGAPDSGSVLESLARDTDGRIVAGVRGSQDLTAAIRDAAAEATAHYVLTYRGAHEEDGAFHPVQVGVKRAGVRVRARSGYWAPSANDRLGAELLADANRPRVAAPLAPASRSSPLIRPWFGLSLGRDDRMRVTFVWEPSPGVPGDRLLATASRVELTVLGEGDDVLFQGPVLPTGPGRLEAPGDEPARAIFHTEPGRLRLRMTIEDADRRPVDSDVRDIIVRDLRGRVAIGTPQFLRARNFREFRTLGGGRAVPVASREFRRTERLLIRFPAYAPDGQQPSVSARLLNRLGQPMRTLDVQSADGEHEIDLMLASLANGEYQVELAAISQAGKTTEVLAFRVTS